MKTGTVIAINKPCGWTSFQVVNKLKWHLRRTFGLKKFKIGHAGTLDPLASGLLLVCVGNATKQIEALQAGIKVYSGTFVLGATTPCFDLEQAIDRYFPASHLTPQSVADAATKFVGEIDQVPPSFSAVKVDGKRAYSAAREGSEVTIAAKKITIYDFSITDFRPPLAPPPDSLLSPDTATAPDSPTAHGTPTAPDNIPSPDSPTAHGTPTSPDDIPSPDSPTVLDTPTSPDSPAKTTNNTTPGKPLTNLYRNPQGSVPPFLPQADFSITCSKGTYIRSIARDLGEALGSGAFLASLQRDRIGDYSLRDAISVDDIETVITPDNPDFSILANLAN